MALAPSVFSWEKAAEVKTEVAAGPRAGSEEESERKPKGILEIPGYGPWPEQTTPAPGTKERQVLEEQYRQTEEELEKQKPVIDRLIKKGMSTDQGASKEQSRKIERYEALKKQYEALRKERYRAMLEDRLEELKGTDELPYIYAILLKLNPNSLQLWERLKEEVERRVGKIEPEKLRKDIVFRVQHYIAQFPLAEDSTDYITHNFGTTLSEDFFENYAREYLNKLTNLTLDEKKEIIRKAKECDF